MARKKIDARVKTLVENSVKTRHRTFFVIVGDNARDQIVNLHYMLSKARVVSRPNVLWCYKKDLGFASDDRARAKDLKTLAKQSKQQAADEELNDPFHLWLAATSIRFCYFKESHNILGSTYGMLVLQDFEAMTPNVLARTMETVEGSGMVILLLPNMDSLKQLYTMAMDVHSRFRSDSSQTITARFNERFLLSLASCHNCLVVDDQLNVLPLSSHIKDIKPIVVDNVEMEDTHVVSKNEKELHKLKESLKETAPLGPLLSQARTLDQAKAILQFVEAISEKTLQSTVALTAARGRGKSSALGIAIASAVAYGYSNIFVTAPSPENLKTLFEFVLKGFDALGLKDRQDYEIVQSTNPHFNKSIIRINVFKEHRQTIQYIQPQDYQKLSQAELVVIDEAAAIPLPVVKKLLGPYLTFISSTVNGYEGTGRSLSLKLIQQLKEKAQNPSTVQQQSGKASTNRKFFEIVLEEPIRYQDGDPIERWLYDLLLLDTTSATPITSKCPHPSDCNLYYVNRDALFAYHEATEKFLKNMMSLFVSSHYKNSPNDLQLMADAPQHHLFVLLGPIDENTSSLPDIYSAIQVCTEGSINRQIVMEHMAKGMSPSGDLIPYLVSRQFQEPEFASLSGARVVRVAVHPDYQRMGYGSRALDLLTQYYNGELFDLDEEGMGEEMEEEQPHEKDSEAPVDKELFEGEAKNINKEIIKPRDRKQLPALLQTLSERRPEPLQYLGVSYGLTLDLYNYWKKSQFLPVYLRLTQNELTGEHTCVMLKSLKNSSTTTKDWLTSFYNDFKKRFLTLLSYDFKTFTPSLCLSVLDYKQEDEQLIAFRSLSVSEFDTFFINFDLKRLEAYAKNMLDFHVILDLVPTISKLFLLKKLPFTISYIQVAILIGLGLQHKEIEGVQQDLNIESNQVLALLNKVIKKVVKYLKQVDGQRFTNKTPIAPQLSSTAVKQATSNVSVEEVMDGDDNDEDDVQKSKKTESSHQDELADVIDQVFDAPNDQKKKLKQKKRKIEEKEMEPEERTAKKFKEKREEEAAPTTTTTSVDKKKSKAFAKQVLANADEFQISSDIIAEQKDAVNVEKGDGFVQLKVSEAQPKKLKSYMFKNKKELEKQQVAEQNKLVKKGGKKKRKIKQ